jgi:hypothetical protein
MAKKNKDWTVFVFKFLIIIVLLLASLLLLSPAIKLLSEYEISGLILEYLIVLMIWQLILFTSILVLSKDLAVIMFNKHFEDNKLNRLNNKQNFEVKVYKNPSYYDQLNGAQINNQILGKSKNTRELALFFERTYHYIYPGQIEFLLALDMYKISTDELEPTFEQIKQDNRPFFDSWNKNMFLEFLKKSDLIEKKDGVFQLTQKGNWFLDYVKDMEYVN